MRDFRDAKAMARALRQELAAAGFRITVSQSLELIAHAFGVPDWNTLAAAIQANPGSERAAPPPPAPEVRNTEGAAVPRKGTELLSGQLESTLNRVFAYARDRKHQHITPEHLLLFLLDDPDASEVLRKCGVDLDAMRGQLTVHLDGELKVPGENPQPSLGFQRILQRAVFHVQTGGHPPVRSTNVLVALFSEKQSRAVILLNEAGMTRLDAVNYLTHGLLKSGGTAPPQ
ncbi:MAG TPA: glyoxalase superfamily protein [Steroidobacteraceae bacterium]|nr:glyoxalase superfamily protein [Steroidobacteraceae bacterium]